MSDDIIGKTLGQYEVLEEVGRGGMATVYRARQTSINRIVAIKVLPRSLLHDPGFYERFEREVDVIAHLEHPHILPIYDYGNAEGIPFIVMRFLAGGSMRDQIRRGLPRLEDIEKPFTQVAQALDHAHKQGIIHRDLKPGNVMLDDNGNAYLTDFGIARVLGSDLTGSAIIGTPAYMSPEQANGFPLDARSDIYALGVVLFELITGREPYQAETPMALLLKHINEPMPAASIYRSDAPPAVENVISRATAKDPGDRYASAGDMARAYRDAIQQPRTAPAATRPRADDDDAPTYIPPETPPQGVAASRTGSTRALPTQPQAADSRVLQQPARSGTSPMIIGAIAVAVIVVLGIIGLLVVPGLVAPPATPAPDAKATHDAIMAVLPTPFGGANQVSKDAYSISVPSNWGSTEDTSNPARRLYIWTAPDSSAFVTLSLVNADLAAENQFRSAIDNYQDQYYASQGENLSLIDEAVAPDGTMRRSYRLVDVSDPRFPPGQMDVFYLNRSPYLAVLETYSADSTGNTLIPTFQMIFDSMRIKSN